MIKKIVASLLAFLMASAMATTRPVFEELDFGTLKPHLIEQKKLGNDGRFPSITLGYIVAGFVKTEYPDLKASLVEIAEKWVKHYGVKPSFDASEYEAQRKTLGYDDAFVALLRGEAAPVKPAAKAADAPKPATAAQAAPVAPAVATPVQTTAVKPAVIEPVKPAGDAIDKAIADLTNKVETLESRGDASAKALKAELATLAEEKARSAAKSQYQEVASKLNNISALVSKAEASAGKAEAAAKVATESASIAKSSAEGAGKSAQTAGEKAAAATESAESAKSSAEEAVKASKATAKAADSVQEGLAKVEGLTAGMEQDKLLLKVALGLGGLACLIAFVAYKKRGVSAGRMASLVEEKVVEVVKNNTGDLADRVEAVEKTAKAALDKVNNLAEGVRAVVFGPDFVSGVELLKRGAPVYFWKAVLVGETDGVMLAFESEEPGYVLVHGIEGQTNHVRLTEGALKGAIGGATKLDDDGGCRLVGLSQDETDALEKRLMPGSVPPFATTVPMPFAKAANEPQGSVPPTMVAA